MAPSLRPVALLVVLGLTSSCGFRGDPELPGLCARGVQSDCLEVGRVEELLVHPRARIVNSSEIPGGTRARILTLAFDDEKAPRRIQVKWRPESDVSSINSPRKEVAAYALQKMFLEPQDYVFPPTRSRCFPLEHYRSAVEGDAQPTYPGRNDCVFGTVSFWLPDAEGFSGFLWRDPEVFDWDEWQNDKLYRRTLSHANLLTYLSSNGDTHTGNWLKVRTPNGQRIYLIDGSIAFSRERNHSLGMDEDYSTIIVPRLEPAALRRLMSLDDAELEVLRGAEQIVESDGLLVGQWTKSAAVPECAPECPDGAIYRGLTRFELLSVRRALWYLRSRVDYGVFSTKFSPSMSTATDSSLPESSSLKSDSKREWLP